MHRRTFLNTSLAATAASALPALSRSYAAEAGVFPLELPALGYAPEALEPHIDAMTMNIHHGKHHAAYVTNLKTAIESGKIPGTDAMALIRDIKKLPEASQTAVRNNGGGHVNHSLFWKWMAPGRKSATPQGKLGEAIRSAFTSFDAFKTAFGEAAAKRFGSGWAWLIVKPSGKLAVVSTPNQDNPWMKGIVPDADLGEAILGIDVWEHAYYLKYQNRRPDYVAAWWNVVNWDEVGKCFAATTA